MANKAAAAITPRDIARNGHIAALVRAEMDKRKWTAADLSERLGLDRKSTTPYPWINGTSAPSAAMRPILAKLFGVPAAALTAREDGAPVKTVNTGAVVLAAPQGRPQVARAGDVLSFSVSATGEARIRLDVALPLETAKPLLRMLLDAGIVFGSGEAEP